MVRFESGLRLKLKHAEYVYLHRLVTGITPRKVWDLLRQDIQLDGILVRTPDGYQQWVRGIADDLTRRFGEVEDSSRLIFDGRPESDDRKTLALYLTQHPHPPILFNMLDGKDYREYIWKQLYPAAADPFRLPE